MSNGQKVEECYPYPNISMVQLLQAKFFIQLKHDPTKCLRVGAVGGIHAI